jgi:hypothetical protein
MEVKFITFREAVLTDLGADILGFGYRKQAFRPYTAGRRAHATRIGVGAAAGATGGFGKEAIKQKVWQDRRVGLGLRKKSIGERLKSATDPKAAAKIEGKWRRKAARRDMGNWVRVHLTHRPEKPSINAAANTVADIEDRAGKHIFGNQMRYNKAKRSAGRGAIAGGVAGSAYDWIKGGRG